ncbi:heme-degrading domain-containing protein [Kutzneria sp. NPDC052558]|uniref:heme-degrading domain-containing protein n=1 Tax=Kutzneria sp. NPDC052558 TaxID=3364121 RepID=UPI0037C7F0C5
MADPELSVLVEQERRLVFERFDYDDAWELGARMVAAARERGLPVVVSIERNGQRLFHAALPGTAADNDAWVERKVRVVRRYGRSSYQVGCHFRAEGGAFEEKSRLDPDLYAAHGGSFPLTIRDVGVVGSITVSGLPQADDHAFVVEQLERFLTSRR